MDIVTLPYHYPYQLEHFNIMKEHNFYIIDHENDKHDWEVEYARGTYLDNVFTIDRKYFKNNTDEFDLFHIPLWQGTINSKNRKIKGIPRVYSHPTIFKVNYPEYIGKHKYYHATPYLGTMKDQYQYIPEPANPDTFYSKPEYEREGIMMTGNNFFKINSFVTGHKNMWMLHPFDDREIHMYGRNQKIFPDGVNLKYYTVPFENYRDALASYSIGIQPSSVKHRSLSTIEMMLSGLIVIAIKEADDISKYSWQSSFIQHGENGFIVRDQSEMVQVLWRINNMSGAERDRIRRNARNTIKNKLNPLYFRTKMNEIYKDEIDNCTVHGGN